VSEGLTTIADSKASAPGPTGTRSGRLRRRLESFRRTRRAWVARHPSTIRALIAISALIALGCGWLFYSLISDLPTRDELRTLGDIREGTTLYDAHNQRIFTLPTQYQFEVPLSQISLDLRNAIVAVEDMRFYQHDGIDSVRVLAATLEDLREGRAAEGASTITQQLARMSFLTPAKTLGRKIKEVVLAQRIERLYSKEEILEFYLNKTYFGDGLYGVEAAARGYFGKSAASLSLPESALLAGLVRAPSTDNPVADLRRATARRDVVLRLMLEQKLIDQGQYAEASNAPVVLRDSLRRDDPTGMYFKEQVRRELVERFGKDRVYRGQLRVYTTVDPEMQKLAEAAVTTSLADLDAAIKGSRPPGRARSFPTPESGDTRLQAALIALDPSSGEVRAIVGGRDVASVGLNRALQSRRQPGSAFKPFVYAAALESGYTPASVLTQLDAPVATLQGAWLPEDEHSTASSMNIRTALRTSSNRAAVKMLGEVGIDRAVAYASHLGVGTPPSVPSLALGAAEVTLSSLTSAYAAFAQKGIVRQPIFIRRIEDEDGSVLFEAPKTERRAISESTAFLMADMLADVIDSGTATRARALGFTLPAAGKTGTSNDFHDAWFVGFTTRLVAGVWVGYDEPRPIGQNGFAGVVAVPLWAQFMKAATKNDPKEWFTQPPDVVRLQVCRVSGLLPADGCADAPSTEDDGNVIYKSAVYSEYFARGTEPHEECSIHQHPPQPPFPQSASESVQGPEAPIVVPVSAIPQHRESPPRSPAPPVQSTSTIPPLPPAPPEPPPASENLPQSP
jgi:penicillin-binding protein 1A